MAPNIEFIEDAIVETANGREKIAKGTVQNGVSEGTAARWERRGKVKRLSSTIERAAAPVPPAPPAPPSPEELEKAEADARAPKTAATPYVPGVDIGEGKTEVATPVEPVAPSQGKQQRGRPTGGRSGGENPLG